LSGRETGHCDKQADADVSRQHGRIRPQRPTAGKPAGAPIETGRFVPSTTLALRLARVFGVRVEQLFELLGDGTSKGSS
jgi:hypothetical protein